MRLAKAGRVASGMHGGWVFEVFALLGASARLTLLRSVPRHLVVRTIREVGAGSAPLLVFIALPVCTAMVLGQGAANASSHIVSSAAIAEIIDLIAPLVVTGVVLVRWPAAEATRVALGAVQGRVETVEELGAVVAPTVLGAAVGMVALWSLHLLLIIVGGILAVVMGLGVPVMQLFVRISTSLSLLSLASGLVFTALCGAVIAATTVQAGLEARTLDDVPRAARHGTIRSLLAAGLLGAAMTFFGGGG